MDLGVPPEQEKEFADFCRHEREDALISQISALAKYEISNSDKELKLKDMQIKSLEAGMSKLYEENERLKKTNSTLSERINQVYALMDEDGHCEDIYHYLCCFLGKFTPDDIDCACCHSDKCNKRLCKYDGEIF